MKKYFKALLLVLSASNPSVIFGQNIKVPTTQSKDRVILNNNDTIYSFYTKLIKLKAKAESEQKTYSWYREGKIITTSTGFAGKLLHGNFQVFYPNKNLMMQGKYINGLKNGTWIYWYSNGARMKQESWKYGLRDGLFTYYNESNDRISKDETYINDQLTYPQRQYINDSTLIYKTFKKGIIVSDTLIIRRK
jgi:antitoxin component YwqK of YwqJK toxin-antitoxin module